MLQFQHLSRQSRRMMVINQKHSRYRLGGGFFQFFFAKAPAYQIPDSLRPVGVILTGNQCIKPGKNFFIQRYSYSFQLTQFYSPRRGFQAGKKDNIWKNPFFTNYQKSNLDIFLTPAQYLRTISVLWEKTVNSGVLPYPV